jgi:hypothetical protein
MERRCVMQTHTDGDATTQDARPRGRYFESIADFFSRKVRCDTCGNEAPKRRYEQTGLTRPMTNHAEWSRWTTVEIEHVCPQCGASVWVTEVPAYYSYV